jgi:hypothetical protein
VTDADLIAWADAHAPVGSTLAVAVRRVLEERDAARAVVLGLAERVYVQCALLTKRAERKEIVVSATDGKYGEITSTGKQFHPGEPIFILRATDALAPHLIRDYAVRCELAGCDEAHVAAALSHAERIAEWQQEHPELVKKPD